jgi:uncharacterized protein YjiS (DUF1127 family)
MALIDISPNWYVALAPLAGWPERGRRARPLGRLQALAVKFLDWRARRETIRALNAVDPTTLRDLGITDIESQVYGDPKDRLRGYDPDWWKRQ